MLGDLPQNARHVRGAPREDVSVGAEKVNEDHFLFAIKGSADFHRLAVGGLWVEGDVLGTLGRLEVASMPLLGVHGLLGHLLQLRGEGFVERQSLGMLDALDITLVGMLKRRADGNDTLRAC